MAARRVILVAANNDHPGAVAGLVFFLNLRLRHRLSEESY